MDSSGGLQVPCCVGELLADPQANGDDGMLGQRCAASVDLLYSSLFSAYGAATLLVADALALASFSACGSIVGAGDLRESICMIQKRIGGISYGQMKP